MDARRRGVDLTEFRPSRGCLHRHADPAAGRVRGDPPTGSPVRGPHRSAKPPRGFEHAETRDPERPGHRFSSSAATACRIGRAGGRKTPHAPRAARRSGLADAPPEVIASARDTATNPDVLSAFALAIIAGGQGSAPSRHSTTLMGCFSGTTASAARSEVGMASPRCAEDRPVGPMRLTGARSRLCAPHSPAAPANMAYGAVMRSMTSSAIARAASVSWARSPETTPSCSDRSLFWLTFHFPSSRAIGISTPTMPLIICSR